MTQTSLDALLKKKAYSAGFTSGFAFNSQLYVEYTLGQGFSREGRDTHLVLVMWSKSF